jgi:hypothetical protein
MGITKSNFRAILNALRNQYDYDKGRAILLSNIYGSDVMPSDNSQLTNVLFKLLHGDFPPTGGFCKIQAFCYDLDFGRSKDIEVSEDPIADLWNDLQPTFSTNYTYKEDITW